MILLYRTGIFAYSVIVHAASLFNEKASRFITGRKNWKTKLIGQVQKDSRYIWFHCASLGEFEQGRPVIEEMKKQFPEYQIILTFFSPSGYEIRKNYNLADIVMYLPIDSPKNAHYFLEKVRPEKAFFIKYEYWYFYISELEKRKIPLYLVSAIFRKNQYFFKKNSWGKWFRKMLPKFEHFFVQDQNSAKLLASVGINNYTISGDTRFDRVATIAAGSQVIPNVEKFKGDLPLLIAGSTWKPDEELLVRFINTTGTVKFIIAPHEVSPANINRLEQMLKKTCIRFSQFNENKAKDYQVLIIDSVGLLSSLYQYGDIAYIGGGFGVGIHNILEAATFGLPVIFGPKYEKFKEAVDLKKKGGAFPVDNFISLENTLNSLLNNQEKLSVASDTCKNYIAENTGATSVIIKKVFNK